MLRNITESQLCFLVPRLETLVSAAPLDFLSLVPSKLPECAGVYLITAGSICEEHPYYVGRTKNLRRRLYTNHLMGPRSNARLKHHLIGSGECADLLSAKHFIRTNCFVRWIEQEGFRERGAIEGYVKAVLFPKHGIDEEH